MAQVTVESGNTLSGLAQQFGSSVDAIAAANNISNPDLIQVGQVLEIPDTPTSPSVNQTQVSPTIGAEELNIDQAPPVVPETPLESTESQITELLSQDFSAPEQEQQSALENTLLELTQQLEGQSAEAIQMEQAAGIPELQAELKGISDDIRAKSAALRQGLVDESGRVIPLGLLRGRQQQLKLQAAAEIGGLQAVGQMVQGNIELANAKIQKSLDLKYKPKEARINTILQALQINESRLSAKEKEFARKQSAQLESLKMKLQRERDSEDAAMNLALEAQRNGASPSAVASVIEKIQSGEGNINDVVRELGNFTQDPLTKLKIQQAQLDLQASQFSLAQAIRDANQTPSGKISVSQKEAADLNKELVGSDQFRSIQELEGSIAALNEFKDLFDKTGVRAIGGGKQALSSKYTTALVNLKEYFNLGVLNGPDLDLLQEIVPDPAVSVFAAGPVAGQIAQANRKAGIEAGVENLTGLIEDSLDSRFSTIYNQFSGYDPNQITGVKDATRKYLNIKAQINPEFADQMNKMKADGYNDFDIVETINLNAGI